MVKVLLKLLNTIKFIIYKQTYKLLAVFVLGDGPLKVETFAKVVYCLT